VTSLAVSTPGVSVKSAQRMMSFANGEADGELDFDDFSRMINSSGIRVGE
jgi:hypothetical protein